MNAMQTRQLLRWSHIIVGSILAAYVYSPLHLDETATLVARLSIIPVLTLTGIALWQQGKLARFIRKSRPA